MDEKQRVIVSTDLPTGAGLQPSNQAMLEPNDSGNLLSHLLKKTTTKPKKKETMWNVSYKWAQVKMNFLVGC